MAGGQCTLLHHIFQRTGVEPETVISKDRFWRTFLLKSMEVQLEMENTK